jgi:Ni/Co efflux regulator RcnB
MRKLLLFLLLAGAAAPALAAAEPNDPPKDRGDRERSEDSAPPPRQHIRVERSGGNESGVRSDRADRAQSMEVRRERFNGGNNDAAASSGGGNEARTMELRRQRFNGGNGAPAATSSGGNETRAMEFRRQRGSFQRSESGGDANAQVNGDAPPTVRNLRRSNRQQMAMPRIVEAPQTSVIEQTREGPRLRQHDRAVPNVMRSRIPVVSQTPREGTQPPLRAERRRSSHASSWSQNWRKDHRYDWRRWRDRHRSNFHLGFYFDPFGWGYRPYSIGWRLWPSYYSSSRYWLSNPYQYRLPYAPPGTRWIRYYNDAILVDTWTGEVVDVIYSFFW